jgi:colicin import membrane protein
MLKFFSQYGEAFTVSVALHVVLFSVMLFSLSSTPTLEQRQPGKQQNVIQAVSVDEKKIEAEWRKLKQQELQRELREAERQKQLQEQARKARQERLQEQKRLAALKRQQQQEAKQLKAQQAAEKQRLAALKKQAEDAAQKRAEEEKRLQKIEQQKKAEQKRIEEQRIAEQKRQEELKRKQAQAEREKLLQEKMAAEEQAMLEKELQGQKLNYIELIAAKVRGNWIRPSTAPDDASCVIDVKQIPGGEIVSYQVSHCTGDQFFKQSVEAAVGKTETLPAPPDKRVFDRNIRFTFKVK